MRLTSIFSASLVCMIFATLPSNVVAGAKEDFLDIWRVYITVCNALLQDPEKTMVSPPSLPGMRLSVTRTEDGAAGNLDFFNDDFTQNAGAHFTRSSKTYAFDCNANGMVTGSVDVLEKVVLDILAKSDRLTVSGGVFKPVVGESLDSEKVVAYVVEGVFADPTVVTTIELYDETVSLAYIAVLPIEEAQ